MTFTSPLLVKDIDIMHIQVTYVTWKIEPVDDEHDIQLYFDCGSELAVNKTERTITWEHCNKRS